jgi:hypothetical protein
MTPPLAVTAIERVTKSWRQEAEERRRISRVDPIADTLDYCAGEIAARLRSIVVESNTESVEERAQRERVTPQTVRIWIRTNQLPAEHGAKGYRIPRDAVRARKSA